ncbi:MAG: cation diffusion facilitator family transporter [Oscillospiraceae bacterium]|nr:cation diffusion facilitator family transporter [Oscillospiraceae bacterium]
MKVQNNEKLGLRVSRNTIIVNSIISVFKLFAGVFANSTAMISDSIHSMSDSLSTIIVMVGIKIAGKEADEEHPYGHERFECMAALILAGILFSVGIGIGWAGVDKIIDLSKGETVLEQPGLLALIAALVSIAAKEWMYWYTLDAAKKTGLTSLKADAWHHRSDALSSIGSFVGILFAMNGFLVMDPLVCVVICVFIIKVSYDIFKDAADKMVDKTCDATTTAAVRAAILEQEGVIQIDLLHTRRFASRIYVDIEIAVDANLSVVAAHDISQRVQDSVQAKFEKVKHCMVHINPYEPPNE